MKRKIAYFLLCCYLLLSGQYANAGKTDPLDVATVQPPCNLPAPANLQYTQPSNYTVQFTWDPVPGAAGYRGVLMNLSSGTQTVSIGVPTNNTYSVIPGDAYLFVVAAMCSVDPPEYSKDTSQINFRPDYIVIELIVEHPDCTPTEEVSDSNNDDEIWTHDWDMDHNYYIEVTKTIKNDLKKLRLTFKLGSEGFELGELDNNPEPSNLCGQTTMLYPGNCEPAPVDEVSNAKFTFAGSTCRISFPSMAELHHYVLDDALPPEIPFESFHIYRSCAGEGGRQGGRSDQESIIPRSGNNPGLQVSPINPFTDQLILYFAALPDTPVKTRLFDLQGIPKIETLIQPGQLSGNTYSLPTAELPPGMYFLQMETPSGQVVVQKVLKI